MSSKGRHRTSRIQFRNNFCRELCSKPERLACADLSVKIERTGERLSPLKDDKSRRGIGRPFGPDRTSALETHARRDRDDRDRQCWQTMPRVKQQIDQDAAK